MSWSLRPRVWVRLIGAVVVALIALGYALRDRAMYGYWRLGPEPTTVYMDPELAVDGYQYWGTENWISSDYSVEQRPGIDLSDWGTVQEVRSPAWVFDAVGKGYTSASRSELGWPLRFARAETAMEPVVTEYVIDETTPFISMGSEVLARQTGLVWVGRVPFASHPLFPGFLLLVAALYGLLLAIESALRIPVRMRSRRRRRRDYCVVCGYDLAGIDAAVCPECGVVTQTGRTGST